tara:strand:+ start:1358 stop:2467 length:1110 start_codon:yes stop_codon:yes gene_type:complete
MWTDIIQIGNHTAKNRIVYPPISTNWGGTDGLPTEGTYKYYANQARGGCGFILVEGTAVAPEGKGSSNSLLIHNSIYKVEQYYSPIASAIREHGAIAYLQLMHAGGQANSQKTGQPAVSPSGIPCKSINSKPISLTTDDIYRIIDDFTYASVVAHHSGFDGVELHLSHGYLLHEFISARTNFRTDEFGGSSFKSRFKIVDLIIQSIREHSPIDISVRISLDDFILGGISSQDYPAIAKILDNYPLSCIHTTCGIYDTSDIKHLKMSQGYFQDACKQFRQYVDSPVITVGNIMTIEEAEILLNDDVCDLVSIGRAQLADPFLVQKTLSKQKINSCTKCKKCMYLKYGREMLKCPIRDLYLDVDEACSSSL